MSWGAGPDRKADKTWVYWLPNENGQGYAWIVMDSQGRFTTLSDWGNYAYWWSSFGERDFRDFVRDLCNKDLEKYGDYLVGKFGMDKGKICHYDQTRIRIRNAVCERRRTGGFTKEEARDEWDLAASVYGERDVHVWYDKTELEDAGELVCYDFSYQVHQFVSKVMPRLKAILDAERTAELTSDAASA